MSIFQKFFKKKGQEEVLLEIESKETIEARKVWADEMNFGKYYPKYELWEDPFLVEGAPIFPQMSKIQTLKDAQRKIGENQLYLQHDRSTAKTKEDARKVFN